MANRIALLAAALALAIGATACGGDEEETAPAGADSDSGSTLEQAQSGLQAAGYQVRAAEPGDLITFLTSGGTVEAEEGFIVSGQAGGLDTFVLTYGDQADAERVVADKREEGVFAVGEQDGVVYLAPDERTLNGIMAAAAG
jgi:hypothetical protein